MNGVEWKQNIFSFKFNCNSYFDSFSSILHYFQKNNFDYLHILIWAHLLSQLIIHIVEIIFFPMKRFNFTLSHLKFIYEMYVLLKHEFDEVKVACTLNETCLNKWKSKHSQNFMQYAFDIYKKIISTMQKRNKNENNQKWLRRDSTKCSTRKY